MGCAQLEQTPLALRPDAVARAGAACGEAAADFHGPAPRGPSARFLSIGGLDSQRGFEPLVLVEGKCFCFLLPKPPITPIGGKLKDGLVQTEGLAGLEAARHKVCCRAMDFDCFWGLSKSNHGLVSL